MLRNRIKKIFYISSCIIAILSFAIKVIIDKIGSTSLNISSHTYIKILVFSIIFTLMVYTLLIYFKYNNDTRRSACSCIYDPKFLCCFLHANHLKEFYGENSKIFDDVELAEIEINVKTKEIWLLSPDFSCEEGNNTFDYVVSTRLREGVHYRFVALDTPISRERARRIFKKYSTIVTRKYIHFYLITSDEYSLFLSLYSLAIYNPTNIDTEAYVCIGETGNNENAIYAKLNEKHTQLATETVRELLENSKEIKII